MEDKRVSPHSNGHGIVTECQTKGAYEEAFRLREHPNAEEQQQVDEIAEVDQEIVVATFVVGVEAYRVKVGELC